MIRTKVLAALLVLPLLMFSGCGGGETAEGFTDSGGGYIYPGLEWGMSIDEVGEALGCTLTGRATGSGTVGGESVPKAPDGGDIEGYAGRAAEQRLASLVPDSEGKYAVTVMDTRFSIYSLDFCYGGLCAVQLVCEEEAGEELYNGIRQYFTNGYGEPETSESDGQRSTWESESGERQTGINLWLYDGVLDLSFGGYPPEYFEK